jgi:hypothetical protein
MVHSGIPFIKIADRVEVTVDLTRKRISGPPVVFMQYDRLLETGKVGGSSIDASG